MQGHMRLHGEGLEEFAHELGIERADLRRRKARAEHQERPAGDIERDTGQRLVHGQQAIRIAGDAAFVAERLAQGLAEREPGILHRMVVVDMVVADGLDLEVDQAVAGDLIEHVIEEADPGRDLGHPGAVEVDLDLERGFVGGSRDRRPAHGRNSEVAATAATPPSKKLSSLSKMLALSPSDAGWGR